MVPDAIENEHGRDANTVCGRGGGCTAAVVPEVSEALAAAVVSQFILFSDKM